MHGSDPWLVIYNPDTRKMDICTLCKTPNIEFTSDDYSMGKLTGIGMTRPIFPIFVGRRRLSPMMFHTTEPLYPFFQTGHEFNIILHLNYGIFMMNGHFSAYTMWHPTPAIGSLSPTLPVLESTFEANAFKIV